MNLKKIAQEAEDADKIKQQQAVQTREAKEQAIADERLRVKLNAQKIHQAIMASVDPVLLNAVAQLNDLGHQALIIRQQGSDARNDLQELILGIELHLHNEQASSADEPLICRLVYKGFCGDCFILASQDTRGTGATVALDGQNRFTCDRLTSGVVEGHVEAFYQACRRA